MHRAVAPNATERPKSSANEDTTRSTPAMALTSGAPPGGIERGSALRHAKTQCSAELNAPADAVGNADASMAPTANTHELRPPKEERCELEYNRRATTTIDSSPARPCFFVRSDGDAHPFRRG